MKFPFISKVSSRTNKFLVVGLNSKDVRCVAVYYDSGTYKMIGSAKEPLEQGSVRNGVVIDKEDVIRAVKTACTIATEDMEEKINNVIFGVGGVLCSGSMTTVRMKRSSTEVIDKKELDGLYTKIEEASEMQAQNEYFNTTGNPEVDLDLITSSNVYIKIDGQEVESLEGKTGSVVEIAVFNAFSPSFHIKTLQDIAKKSGLNILAVGSEMYALSQWMKQYSIGLNDFILMSVDNECTTVAVIFGGGIVGIKSLDIGLSHFVDSVSEKMGITEREADKILRGYINGSLSESETALIQKCIEETLRIWLMGMELLFGEFSNVKTFAPRIYLTGHGAEIKDIISTLKSEPWTKSIAFKTFPEISKINFSDFSKITDATGKAGGTDWLNPIFMSIIFEEIFGK